MSSPSGWLDSDCRATARCRIAAKDVILMANRHFEHYVELVIPVMELRIELDGSR